MEIDVLNLRDWTLSSSFVFALLDEITALRKREISLLRNEREVEELRESLRGLLAIVARKDEDLRKTKSDIRVMQQEFDDALSSPVALSSYRSTVAIPPQDQVSNHDGSSHLNGSSTKVYTRSVDGTLTFPCGGQIETSIFSPTIHEIITETPCVNNAETIEVSSMKSLEKNEELRIAKRKLLSFEMSEVPRCEDAYRIMRRIIPPDVFQLSIATLTEKYGLPRTIACRLWEKKALWLIVMHKYDISKIHIADLRGKFQYDNTYDVIEMRAIWKCLPEWGSGDKKAEWRDDFKRRLNALTYLESIGSLSADNERNKAYHGYEPLELFDPSVEIKERYNVAFQEQSPDKIPKSNHHDSPVVKSSSYNDLNDIDFGFQDVISRNLMDDICNETALSIPFSDDTAKFSRPINGDERVGRSRSHSDSDMNSEVCTNNGSDIAFTDLKRNLPEEMLSSGRQIVRNAQQKNISEVDLKDIVATSNDITSIGNTIYKDRLRNTKDNCIERVKNNSYHDFATDVLGTMDKPRSDIQKNVEDKMNICLRDREFVEIDLHLMMDEALTDEKKNGTTITFDNLSYVGVDVSHVYSDSEYDVDIDLYDMDKISRDAMKVVLSDTTSLLEDSMCNYSFNGIDFLDRLQERDHLVLEDLSNQGQNYEDNLVFCSDPQTLILDGVDDVILHGNIVNNHLEENEIEYKCDNLCSKKIVEDTLSPGKNGMENYVESVCNTSYYNSSFEDNDSSSSSNIVGLYEDYGISYRPLPSEEDILDLLRVNLEGLVPFFANKHHYSSDDFDLVFGKQKANKLLLKCADDPDSLQDGLDTFKFLVEIMHADVNTTDAHDGRTALGSLINAQEIGTYLIQRGADLFMKDKNNTSVLDLCIEYNELWILDAFQATENSEIDLFSDKEKLSDYVFALILCGYASRATLLIDFTGKKQSLIHIGEEKASQLMKKLDGKTLIEPVETFELLMRCGAQV